MVTLSLSYLMWHHIYCYEITHGIIEPGMIYAANIRIWCIRYGYDITDMGYGIPDQSNQMDVTDGSTQMHNQLWHHGNGNTLTTHWIHMTSYIGIWHYTCYTKGKSKILLTAPIVSRNPCSMPSPCHEISATWWDTMPNKNTTSFSVACKSRMLLKV